MMELWRILHNESVLVESGMTTEETHVMNLPDGCLVRTRSTRMNKTDAVTESLVYVPGTHLDDESNFVNLHQVQSLSMYSLQNSRTESGREDTYRQMENYSQYLNLLLHTQSSGHDVHTEINEVLEKLEPLYMGNKNA